MAQTVGIGYLPLDFNFSILHILGIVTPRNCGLRAMGEHRGGLRRECEELIV